MQTLSYVEKCNRYVALTEQRERISDSEVSHTVSPATAAKLGKINDEIDELASDPAVNRYVSTHGPGRQTKPDQVGSDSVYDGMYGTSTPDVQKWIDGDGKLVRCLTKNDRFTDLPYTGNGSATPGLSLGRALVGMSTGDWRHAKAEQLAMNESSNTAGGFLVADEMSRRIIDLARARTAVIQAGAITIPMESDRLTLARVETDPAMEVKAENAAFTEVEPVFGAISLTAFTIGCLIPMSRELAADAPNMAGAVEDVISKALAAEIDRQALVGSGSEEMLGLLNKADIGTTAAGGAITWELVLGMLAGVEAANETPNSWVCHPTIKNDLSALTSGDGTNSAKLWLPPPPDIAALSRHISTNCPTANVFLGDFSQMAIGLRSAATVESTTTGSDSFKKYQILIRIVWRGDVGLLRPAAFHSLTGVTT